LWKKKAKEIQSKKLAIGNVEKDSNVPMKFTAREASRDRKRIVDKSKDDANWSDL
jgi:hypothetical protein